MYTLRFPFRLPPGREIAVTLEAGQTGELGFSLARHDDLYILTIIGFPTENAAREYVPTVWAGLMWMLLERGLFSLATLDFGKVTYADDQEATGRRLGFKEPVDGLTDGGSPSVYPTDAQIKVITAGNIDVLQTYHAPDILGSFLKGVAYAGSANLLADEKLKLAFELYGAYFTEASEKARFLTLVMALEALASPAPRSAKILELQDRFLKEAKTLAGEYEGGPEDAIAAQALINDLQSRRGNSLTDQVRSLVRETLQVRGDADAEEMGRKAAKVYGQRGSLVHDGQLPPAVLQRATVTAKEIVERVLKAKFLTQAGA